MSSWKVPLSPTRGGGGGKGGYRDDFQIFSNFVGFWSSFNFLCIRGTSSKTIKTGLYCRQSGLFSDPRGPVLLSGYPVTHVILFVVGGVHDPFCDARGPACCTGYSVTHVVLLVVPDIL